MKILGVKIDNLTMNEVLWKIKGFLEDGKQHYIVTPNPEFLVKAQEDKEFKKILNKADLAVPDGIGLVFASWFLGEPIKERITGVDLMEEICKKAAQEKWQVFLLGAEEGVAKKAAENLRRKYEGLQVVDIRTVLEMTSFCIRTSFQGLSLLFVALGMPKQEKWIVHNLKKMPSVKLAIGIGGAFDFIAGRIKRAPKFIRSIGMEWLWRLILQPWRIRRIFKAVIKFPLSVLFYKFHKNSS
ncbi:MAG: WecB/TagA/CpsF family glycosyltransferase [Parcubacteria group bacterium]|nr:WecB/TagA/CpsF family glycosyltransferase [Parcubacteria group bacterium]